MRGAARALQSGHSATGALQRGALRGHAAVGALRGGARAGPGFQNPNLFVLCRCTYRWKGKWRAAMAEARVSPIRVLLVLKL